MAGGVPLFTIDAAAVGQSAALEAFAAAVQDVFCRAGRSGFARRAPPIAAEAWHLASQVPPGDHQRLTSDRRSPLRQVCAFIDEHIADPHLDADRITRALGLSRASLYRLFVSSGGVGRYIRRRRLSGAALELSDPTRRVRIGEVAARWGFASDASFARAFRQAFDIAPRAARERSLAFLAPVEGEAPDAPVSERGFAYWMRTLHANRATERR